jgi:hypothetical protein
MFYSFLPMTLVIVSLHTTIVLYTAFVRYFGSPFTLLCGCIARIHSLLRIDCIAWVCGMVDVLELCMASGASSLDQTVTLCLGHI